MKWFSKKAIQEEVCVEEAAFTSLTSKLDDYIKLKAKKILFLEDDLLMSTVVEKLFSKHTDKELKIAHGFDEFAKDIINNSVALIFSDVRVHHESAIEKIHKLWLDGLVNCPIFFYSGEKAFPNELVMIKEMGATFYDKPIQLDRLEKIIMSVVGVETDRINGDKEGGK